MNLVNRSSLAARRQYLFFLRNDKQASLVYNFFFIINWTKKLTEKDKDKPELLFSTGMRWIVKYTGGLG